MNILLISPYFKPAVGGVETHLDDLSKYLISKGHNLIVRTYKALSSKDRGLGYERNGLLEIYRMNWPDFNLNNKLEKFPILRFIYVFTGLFLDSLIYLLSNSKKIDVIQVHGFIASVIGVILKKIFKIRLVVNTHVGFSFKNSTGLINTITKWTLKNCDTIMVLTNSSMQELINIGIPKNKIIIYHYWVDQKVFRPVNTLNKKAKVKALFVGRLVAQKGLDRIFKLASEFKNIEFIIVGSGPLQDFVKIQSSKYKNINFLGKISNDSLTSIYNSSCFLLVPSESVNQTYEEGIPRVIIESLSCGRPVLTTSTGGIPDVFSKDMGIITKDNYQSFKEGFNLMINSYHGYKNCRKVAEKLFSINNAKIIELSLE